MIVIDTSALIAVTNHEPERLQFLSIIAAADRCVISAVTLLETRIVTLARFGNAGTDQLAEWLASFAPDIVAFDQQQADVALMAYRSYGRGMQSGARLNFGDCASYALARVRNLPLLYKGDDFAATDIRSAT